MFDVFLDYVKKLFKSRLFPITLIYLAIFCVVIHRLFVLQIVQGSDIIKSNVPKNVAHREIDSTRGNFYDCNGKLLASNVLTYSVVMDDSTKVETNEQRNAIVYQMIKMIEDNGDTLDNEFYLQLNKDDELEFTVEKTALTRFKKKVYQYAFDKYGELTEDQNNATAQDVYDFLRTGKNYKKTTTMFEISDDYSVEDTLKIMSVRFALFCNYPKYLPVTVASKISEKTIAAIKESSDELIGVEVEQQTHRVYENSTYFSNIIGYTGSISLEELEANKDIYDSTDVVGKTGLEAKYENYLRGTKGVETVSVTTNNRVIDVIDRTAPKAGNDIYLTINSDLQIASYKLLERELANILLENITSKLDYGSKGESAGEILIPIYEVYYALINNNIIDIDQFDDKDASSLEKETYQKYKTTLKNVFHKLDSYLSIDNTVTNNNAGEMEDYLNYFYTSLKENELLLTEKIPSDNVDWTKYKSNEISLSSFLKIAFANNWIDLSILEVGDKFFTTEELYEKLITYTKNKLKEDAKFNKMIYRSLVFSYNLSGSQICLLLFDQGVLEYSESDVAKLNNGSISPYTFITNKINNLEITPAMLALTPCSGSVIVTDVNTGDVLALVSYPGYDNNKFAGKIDSKYWNTMYNDLTKPMRNKPTSDLIAPGSTFKMVTSVAALEEGVVGVTDLVDDLREYTKIVPSPKCHIYPGSHGSVNIMEALAVSCNYYFFEMGWRLSRDNSGKYDTELGLSKLKEYATMFGLNETSGIELGESEPNISTTDSVRSAIGQGSNAYTPAELARYVTTIANRGTCYNITLLDKIIGKDKIVIIDNSAAVNHKLDDVKTSTWTAVQEGMYDVVNAAGGSVTSTFKNLPVTVAGKTGTSQISKSVPNNALFVSFAPYEKPEISITTVIPNGYTSHNTALLAKNIYSFYFGYEDEKTILSNAMSQTDHSSTIE